MGGKNRGRGNERAVGGTLDFPSAREASAPPPAAGGRRGAGSREEAPCNSWSQLSTEAPLSVPEHVCMQVCV